MFVSVVITIVMTYLLTEILGYIVHAIAHWHHAGILYRAHLRHHVRYTTKHFADETYVAGPFLESFIPWFIPVYIVLLISMWYALPIYLFITGAVTSVMTGLVNSYIHDSFHTNEHWLNRFKTYRRMRALHYVHHKHVTKNIGIYMFWLDRLRRRFLAMKLIPATY